MVDAGGDRVVVVGAGLAGLAAARRLVALGRDVVVLEARERVGGRTEGTTLGDGTPLELGGQWIGPTQTRIYELVAELGLETFPTYNDEGEILVDLLGKRSRMGAGKDAVPRVSPFVIADLAQGMARFTRASNKVSLTEPWSGPRAERLDGQTCESWIRRNLRTEAGRAYFRLSIEALFAAEAADMSLLHALFYCHSGTDLETMLATSDGAQQDRIVGGSVRIAQAMAAELADRVRLGVPVRRVAHDDGGVRVTLDDGEQVTGAAAVLTLPPTLVGRLVYEPALPSWRDQLTQRVPAGSVMKTYAVYDEPFWRADGLNGQAVSDVGPVKITFDNSPPSGSPGVLLGFIEAGDARRWARRSPADRRTAVLGCLTRYFGPRAAEPREYLERDWTAEEYSRGCYGAHFAPGVWTGFGHALRQPIGPLHWAGAECATVWNGYMEGAVRSGEAAADAVLAQLG